MEAGPTTDAKIHICHWLDDVMPFLDSIIEMGPETPVGKKAAELKPQLMEGIAKEMQKQNLEAKKKADESKKK